MNRLMISFALFAAACGGKKDEPAPTTGSDPAPVAGSAKPAGSGSAVAAGSGSAAAGSGSAVAAGSGSATAVAAKATELPTAEDFEDDAASRITEKNVETEVKALEKEIGEN